MLGHPYNSLCFPGDARRREVATEFRTMMVKLESCTSLPTAKGSSTTRKACYKLEFNKKGLPYGQVVIRPDLPFPRTRKPLVVVPSTVDVVPRPAKPVKPNSPSVKRHFML